MRQAAASSYSTNAVTAFIDSHATSVSTADDLTFGYSAIGDLSFAGLNQFDSKTLPSFYNPYQIWNANSPQDDLVPAAIYNPTGTDLILGTVALNAYELALHPGKHTDAVLRFMAPTSGTYNFSAAFEGADTAGTTTGVVISKNGVLQDSGTVNGNHSSALGYAVDKTYYLVAGEFVQFNVSSGASYYNDSTGLAAALVVTAVPFPASVWGGGVLLAGLGVATKLRRR